jgi:hypothetical protein
LGLRWSSGGILAPLIGWVLIPFLLQIYNNPAFLVPPRRQGYATPPKDFPAGTALRMRVLLRQAKDVAEQRRI